MKRVLFVCLGNICRSPTAEGVFQHAVDEAGLRGQVHVDSCGVSDWHVDKAPDQRSQLAARRRGVDISHLRGRQLTVRDFYEFDYLLAMDKANLQAMQAMKPADSNAHVGLFLAFAGMPEGEVPDPYYGDSDDFERVVEMTEAACAGLLAEVAGDQ